MSTQSLPADLAVQGWQLKQGRGGTLYAVVTVNDEQIRTRPRRDEDQVVEDARWLGRELLIAPTAQAAMFR